MLSPRSLHPSFSQLPSPSSSSNPIQAIIKRPLLPTHHEVIPLICGWPGRALCAGARYAAAECPWGPLPDAPDSLIPTTVPSERSLWGDETFVAISPLVVSANSRRIVGTFLDEVDLGRSHFLGTNAPSAPPPRPPRIQAVGADKIPWQIACRNTSWHAAREPSMASKNMWWPSTIHDMTPHRSKLDKGARILLR